MLENESLAGINDQPKLSGMRSSSFNTNNESKNSERYTIEFLIKKLNEFLNILNSHGVDPEIVKQIFKQVCNIYYFFYKSQFSL
jgi:myosin-5